jgi:tRNA A-37 threonylcarbamoyl transferase component Bud32
MTNPPDDPPNSLSPQGMQDLLALLVHGEHRRVSSAMIDGRPGWIKRFGEKPALAKRLHAALSPLTGRHFLRSSRSLDAQGRVEREARKIEAFRQAGFHVPDVLFHDDSVLVLSEMQGSLQDDLRRLADAPDAHDRLLVEAAAGLGAVHAAGLCHGRPHPRDMFYDGTRWGFIDFEEEPEAVMPLADAQARDLWLLYSPLADGALKPATPGRAFAAYCREAPADTIASLKEIVRFFSPFAAIIRALPPVRRRADARRLVKATDALRDALSTKPQPHVPEAHGGQHVRRTQE